MLKIRKMTAMAIAVSAMLVAGLVVAGLVAGAMAGRLSRNLRRSRQGARSHSATLALFGFGLAGLSLAARRRRPH